MYTKRVLLAGIVAAIFAYPAAAATLSRDEILTRAAASKGLFSH